MPRCAAIGGNRGYPVPAAPPVWGTCKISTVRGKATVSRCVVPPGIVWSPPGRRESAVVAERSAGYVAPLLSPDVQQRGPAVISQACVSLIRGRGTSRGVLAAVASRVRINGGQIPSRRCLGDWLRGRIPSQHRLDQPKVLALSGVGEGRFFQKKGRFPTTG